MNNLFLEYVNSFVENIHKIRQHWATRIDHSTILPFTQQNLSHLKTNKINIIFFKSLFLTWKGLMMIHVTEDQNILKLPFCAIFVKCVRYTKHGISLIWVAMKLNINKARVSWVEINLKKKSRLQMEGNLLVRCKQTWNN